jgi:molybdenum cofactor cytidylyltransferase
MKFGPVPVRHAVGGILAHAIKENGLTLKKGIVISDEHVQQLLALGIAEITVAQLSKGDVMEDEAARQLAASIMDVEVIAEAPFTGRANLFAASAGILVLDALKIDAGNAVDEAITIATLPNFRMVEAGEMVATIKIIPFAVAGTLLKQAIAAAAESIRIAPFAPKKIAVFSTLMPGFKSSIIDKTLRVLDERLVALGTAERLCDIRVHHTVDDLAEVLPRARALGADIAIVFGVSAISDRRDVIPAAIETAGGSIVHLGMPVDPGNLLLLGHLDGMPVIGAPGCARSPKENGFDWVLQRLVADLEVTADDIRKLGVGGLLMEIVSRPQPRDPVESETISVAGIILAAGKGTRMGGGKMTAMLGGKALVRYAADAATAAGLKPVIAVLGHDASNVVTALDGVEFTSIHNPDFADGMATSLKAGIAALPADVTGALILLGDMPHVTPVIIQRLLKTFADNPEASAVVPTAGNQRGNPILIGRALFASVLKLEGDMGARKLLDSAGKAVIEVAVDDVAILTDVDTSETLDRLNTISLKSGS